MIETEGNLAEGAKKIEAARIEFYSGDDPDDFAEEEDDKVGAVPEAVHVANQVDVCATENAASVNALTAAYLSLANSWA